MDISHRWINSIDEFGAISKKWDEAVLASGEDNPFLLSDFIITWWKYYSKEYVKLKIFVLYRNGKMAGGIPLCQNNKGYLEPPGRISANYTECLSVGDSKDVWESFFNSLSQIDGLRLIRLKRVRKDRIDEEWLKSLASKHTDILIDLYPSGRSYLIDIPEDFTKYIGTLPKKLRYYIRRSEDELFKLGKISIYTVKDCDEIKRLCDIFIDLSRSSFRARKMESAFENNAYCEFFRELMGKFCAAGYLDVNALKLDDRIIAVHFGYSIANNLNYILPAFDAEFSNLNPGHLLIYKLVELGSKRKNNIVDLYTGYQFYKEQWSSRKEDIIGIDIRPNCISSRIRRFVDHHARNSAAIKMVRQNLRKHPLLLDMARRMKRAVQYDI